MLIYDAWNQTNNFWRQITKLSQRALVQGSFLDCKHCKTETINIYTVLSLAQCSFSGWAYGGTNRNIKSCWIPFCNIYSLMITKHACAEYCGLWPCSARTRKPAMRPGLVIWAQLFSLPITRVLQWPGPFLVLPIFIRSNLEGMMPK